MVSFGQECGEETERHTIGVPYRPEIAKGLSPNPIGGGDPKNTACVTFIPTLKPKSMPCHTINILVEQ